MSPVSFASNLVCGLVLASLSLPALAARELRFDDYAVPGGGSVAMFVGEGDAAISVALAGLDADTRATLLRAMKASQFTGKVDTQLDLPGVAGFDRVFLVGMGSETATPRALQDAGGRVGQFAARSPAPRVEMLWNGARQAAEHLAFGAALGQYDFDRYRSPSKVSPPTGVGELVVRSTAGAGAGTAYEARWKPVAEAVRFSRDLVTEPGSAVYPEEFVARTRAALKGVPKVSIEVLDVAAMERLGMGGILAVGKGSERPPRLMVVRYDGGRAGDAPLAFVGKGITFDTGGISIKGREDLWEMKYDMTGAAVVTGAVMALAGRRAPVNAIAVSALAENMPSGSASRPGDVVTTMSGKTFEIISTDAEGRMVLTDAVWYAQDRYKPRLVIDVATLTGSVVTALGGEYAGLFSRDDALAAQLLAAGAASGEELWRLPLHASYGKDLESPIADLRNGGVSGAGAGVGAHFIGEWIAPAMPWAHLDIAGMAWRKGEPAATVPTGATAFGVRLLDQFVRDNYE